jgi:transcriptional regulator with XRE-family HTH domain
LNTTEIVGKRIRQRRTALGYSQEQLAELSDVYPTYIGQLERGEKNPTIDTLSKVTKGLKVSLSEFFSGIEDFYYEDNDNYSYKCYKLIEQQPIDNQEILYRIMKNIIDLKK